MGVGISTILVASTKVQRAIVVLLTLASAFKVYVKFFFMLWARLPYEISCVGIGLVQVFKFDFKVFPVMGKVLLGKLSCTQTGKVQ